MSDRPPIHIYLHCLAGRPESRSILNEIVTSLVYSGLYDRASSLTCVSVGEGSIKGILYPRFKHYHDGPETGYEFVTQKRLWLHAQQSPNDLFLELQTKGASRTDHLGVMWRRLLLAGTVGQWERCVDLLNTYETVGPFYNTEPFPHYSGTMFWARGAAMASLPEPGETEQVKGRYWAEYWPLSGGASHFDTLPDTPSFEASYRSELYRDFLPTSSVHEKHPLSTLDS